MKDQNGQTAVLHINSILQHNALNLVTPHFPGQGRDFP